MSYLVLRLNLAEAGGELFSVGKFGRLNEVQKRPQLYIYTIVHI